mmetsp:Transcript_64295/g.119488  ORF Transcript_64295/g.119488 Transcript_64295/m.119488 type:complete len:214 (+) Transcript_64295:319-960(+)
MVCHDGSTGCCGAPWAVDGRLLSELPCPEDASDTSLRGGLTVLLGLTRFCTKPTCCVFTSLASSLFISLGSTRTYSFLASPVKPWYFTSTLRSSADARIGDDCIGHGVADAVELVLNFGTSPLDLSAGSHCSAVMVLFHISWGPIVASFFLCAEPGGASTSSCTVCSRLPSLRTAGLRTGLRTTVIAQRFFGEDVCRAPLLPCLPPDPARPGT